MRVDCERPAVFKKKVVEFSFMICINLTTACNYCVYCCSVYQKNQYNLKKNNKFYFISPQQVILFHCTCLKSLIFVVFTRAICLSQAERAFQWPRYHEAVGSTSSPLWWSLVRNQLTLSLLPPPGSLNNSPLKFYSPGWRETLWEQISCQRTHY